jgi:hypothetical protein
MGVRIRSAENVRHLPKNKLQGKIDFETISKVDCRLLGVKVCRTNRGNSLPFRELGCISGVPVRAKDVNRSRAGARLGHFGGFKWNAVPSS